MPWRVQARLSYTNAHLHEALANGLVIGHIEHALENLFYAPGRSMLDHVGWEMKAYPDEHYKSWPFKISEDFIKENGHLKSQTRKAELAGFLSTRSSCCR